MSQFMPYNENNAKELNDKLSSTIFQSVEKFVGYYNDGLISRNHEDIQQIANDIEATYRNVKKQGDQLVFISSLAVHINELESFINSYKLALTLASKLEESDQEIPGDFVFFISKNGELSFNNGQEVTKLNTKKVVVKTHVLEDANFLLSSVQNLNFEDHYAFTADDVRSLDKQRIKEMYSLTK